MAITDDERERILAEAFPPEIMGYERASSVPADFPYSEEFPPFLPKDKVVYELTNLLIRQILSNDKSLKDLIDKISDRLANADMRLATQAVKGLMSAEDKTKLDGIAEKANNYTHPTSGVTAGIYKSVNVNSQGHVTGGTNPTTLAGYGITDAAAKNHGNHVPATESPDNTRFLRNDNTWKPVTPSNIGAAANNHIHDERYYTENEIDTKFRNAKTTIIQGYIRDGQTIPIPSGYTEENCLWILSPVGQRIDDDDAFVCLATTQEWYTNININHSNNFNDWIAQKNTHLLADVPRGRVVVCRTHQRPYDGIAMYTVFANVNWKYDSNTYLTGTFSGTTSSNSSSGGSSSGSHDPGAGGAGGH